MSRYALISGDEVITVVEQDSQPTIEGTWVDVTRLHVGPGDRYANDVVIKPAEKRHITQLAFLSRFTDDEAVAIDLASIGATQAAAQVRRYLAKVNAASYIDLNRPDTRAGVHALEAVGLIGAGRASEVLDGPIRSEEAFYG